MQFFVTQHSLVRHIWGKSDTVLLIFAGASAEFALNKAVDWLYFTGRLPADPLGRLFSTVQYAQSIIFLPLNKALATIDKMREIHVLVEHNRGKTIPDWAYRDVLFMLIYYSIAAYELLERKLSDVEKEEVYNVFYRVGDRMGLKDLPLSYTEWLPARKTHLMEDLQKSTYTTDLFQQYKKHLGWMRYQILIEGQKLVAPDFVKKELDFKHFSFLRPLVPLYKISRILKIDYLLKSILFPNSYKDQIENLDINTPQRRYNWE